MNTCHYTYFPYYQGNRDVKALITNGKMLLFSDLQGYLKETGLDLNALESKTIADVDVISLLEVDDQIEVAVNIEGVFAKYRTGLSIGDISKGIFNLCNNETVALFYRQVQTQNTTIYQHFFLLYPKRLDLQVFVNYLEG